MTVNLKKPHKYRAVQTVVDGIKFPSKHEARTYSELKLKVKAGVIDFFLRQVPIDLPGGVKMRIDFVTFERIPPRLGINNAYVVEFVDAKGVITKDWKNKKKIAEAIYPITIETT